MLNTLFRFVTVHDIALLVCRELRQPQCLLWVMSGALKAAPKELQWMITAR